MTKLLIRLFIKEPENISSPQTRAHYAVLSSITGIICNFLLFGLKYAMGVLSNSIAIISDAFNNLSDGAGCVVTLLGCRMAAKPADKDHPFGHGRIEYLISLVISAIILFMGFELMKSSVGKIFSPEKTEFSLAALLSLIVSIGVKLWMSLFNTFLGKKISSPVMLASAKDSRSDVIATAAAAVALVCSLFTDLPIDGITGVIVSVFILKAGLEIIRDTVDELLGKPASPEITNQLRDIICSDSRIVGVHDMIIHDYGPGNMIGSCHAEVRSTEDVVSVHDLIDRIERQIHHEMKILMTIHMDPIEVDNEQVNCCRCLLEDILTNIDPQLSLHDFRIVTGETHVNLIFDLVVPYSMKLGNDELKRIIDDSLSGSEVQYYTVITFDRDFV